MVVPKPKTKREERKAAKLRVRKKTQHNATQRNIT